MYMAWLCRDRRRRSGAWGARRLRAFRHSLLLLGVFLGLLAPSARETARAGLDPDATYNAVITNCNNDTQLFNALSVAGTSTITFACGSGPRTIPITSYLTVQGNITVEGAGRITLDGGDTYSLLHVLPGGRLTLRNLTLANGAFLGAYPIENFGRLTLSNVTVSSNQSTEVGGALYNKGILLVNGSRFLDNQGLGTPVSATSGAAIYNDGGTATVTNSVFRDNRITSTIGGGGAIAVAGGNFTIRHSRFENNRAREGGALYLITGSVVTVTHSTFVANEARHGGAVASGGELQLDYSRLCSNSTTAGDGGAIWVLDGDLDMTYSTLDNNVAARHGSAIACSAVNLSVIHSTLNDNRAGVFGGGIYSECDVNLTNSTLSDNVAQEGGGLYQSGNSRLAAIGVTTIAYNRAAVGAGVLNDSAATSDLALQATLLAWNFSQNCAGTILSNGDNASSDACNGLTAVGDRNSLLLLLAPLGRYGGPTATHYLPPDSPARDAIPNARCAFAVDQRGVSRPKGPACDVGAVEVFSRLWLPALRH